MMAGSECAKDLDAKCQRHQCSEALVFFLYARKKKLFPSLGVKGRKKCFPLSKSGGGLDIRLGLSLNWLADSKTILLKIFYLFCLRKIFGHEDEFVHRVLMLS